MKKTYIALCVLGAIVILFFAWRSDYVQYIIIPKINPDYGEEDYINPDIPAGFLYAEGEIPEEFRLKPGTEKISIFDLSLLDRNSYYCKESGEPAEIVEYYEHHAGRGYVGGDSFRYAVACGDEYLIVGYGPEPYIYGPFKLQTREYGNSKYGFSFTYPANWTIEEESLAENLEGKVGEDFYTGIAVTMGDPSLPKKTYDCCYTPEEVEEYGEKPKLALLAIDSINYPTPVSQETFGEKTRQIFSELTAKGYPPQVIENLLSLIPSSGEMININEGTTKPPEWAKDPEWKDRCSDIRLVTINGYDVIRFSGCTEGVVESTGALFVRKDNLIIHLEDHASEYSKRGDLDNIIESFKFDNK